MPTSIQYDPSGRVKCRECGQPIQKGSLRVGHAVSFVGDDGIIYSWNHPTCWKPNVRLVSDPSQFVGWDTIEQSDREKMCEILSQIDRGVIAKTPKPSKQQIKRKLGQGDTFGQRKKKRIKRNVDPVILSPQFVKFLLQPSSQYARYPTMSLQDVQKLIKKSMKVAEQQCILYYNKQHMEPMKKINDTSIYLSMVMKHGPLPKCSEPGCNGKLQYAMAGTWTGQTKSWLDVRHIMCSGTFRGALHQPCINAHRIPIRDVTTLPFTVPTWLIDILPIFLSSTREDENENDESECTTQADYIRSHELTLAEIMPTLMTYYTTCAQLTREDLFTHIIPEISTIVMTYLDYITP